MKTRILIASLIVLVGGVGGNILRYFKPQPQRPVIFEAIPFQLGDYSGKEHRFSEQSYEILQADTSTLRLYERADGKQLWLFVGYFGSQKYGSQIHSPRNCLPGSGWKIQTHLTYQMTLANGPSREVNRLIISRNQQRSLMFYWFETRGGAISNEYGLKWDLVKNSLMFRPTDAAIVRLNIPLGDDDDIDMVSKRAIAWLDQFGPTIDKALPFKN